MAWAILDGLANAAKGAGKLVGNTLGLVYDTAVVTGQAVNPFTSNEEFDREFAPRFGNRFLGTDEADPHDGVFGNWKQIAPAWAERAGNATLQGIETAYREGTTGIAAAHDVFQTQSLGPLDMVEAPAPGGGLFSRDQWVKSYNDVSRDKVSPGQRVAIGLFDRDQYMDDGLLDEGEVAESKENSALVRYGSGTVDVAARLFLDPTIVVGKGVQAVRAARAITVKADAPRSILPDDLQRLTRGGAKGRTEKSLVRVAEEMGGLTAAQIRDRHPGINPAVASALSLARNTEDRLTVLAAALGDAPAMNKIQQQKAELVAPLAAAQAEVSTLETAHERLTDLMKHLATRPEYQITSAYAQEVFEYARRGHGTERMNELAAQVMNRTITFRDFERSIRNEALDHATLLDARKDVTLWRDLNRPESLTAAKTELQALYNQQEHIARMELAETAMERLPTRLEMAAGKARSSFTHTQFYQESLYSRPLRWAFQMRPHHLLNLNDQTSDVQLARLLQQSKLTPEEQGNLRSRYVHETTPEGRLAIAQEAEERAVRSIMPAGMTEEAFQKLLEKARENKALARRLLQKNVEYDGKGRAVVTINDETGATVKLALYSTQTADLMPLVDLEAMRKVVDRRYHAGFRHKLDNASDNADYLASKFYDYWKPAVLLRLGWTQRTITDDLIRRYATLGGHILAASALHGVKNAVVNAKVRNGHDSLRQLALDAGIDEDVVDGPMAQRLGLGETEVEGVTVQGFGGDAGAINAFWDRASSDRRYQNLARSLGTQQLKEVRAVSGDWKVIDPTRNPEDHLAAWRRDLNQQIGGDPLARMFLEGKTRAEVLEWLRRRPEGQAHAARLPHRRRRMSEWVDRVEEAVEDYTLGNPELKALALEQRVSAKALERMAPELSSRPLVHGEMLKDALGNSETGNWLDRVIQRGYHLLGTLPTDMLVRHPFAHDVYTQEVGRLVRLYRNAANEANGALEKAGKPTIDAPVLDEATIRKIESKARHKALDVLRETLYEGDELSNLAYTMRHVLPFYNAMQNGVTTYARLAWAHPDRAAKLMQLWMTPERAGFIVDENGQQVSFDHDGDKFIRIPNAFQMLPGMEWMNDDMFINKKSANLSLSLGLGAGPPVTVPANYVLKHKPGLEESLKLVLPFGYEPNTMDLITPAYVNRLATIGRGEDDRAFVSTMFQIGIAMEQEWRDLHPGQEPSQAVLKDIEKRALNNARIHYAVRSLANLTMPASPIFKSPYQPVIDKYRIYMAEYNKDPHNTMHPDARILAEDGELMFTLVQSGSKSLNGVAPTQAAYDASKEYADLLEQYPTWGRTILGEKASSDKFSNSIYEHQFATGQREALSYDERRRLSNVDRGWTDYSRAMDLIEAARLERNLPNLAVKEAADLKAMKSMVTANIAEENPDWFDEFQKRDDGKQAENVAAARTLVNDPRLNGRPEIQTLARYLQGREMFKAVLKERAAAGGAKTLTASSNMDLQLMWRTFTSDLVESDLGFADIYYVRFERDTLED